MFHRQFFLGPMTKNVVDTVLEFNNSHGNYFGFIPSRRQIEAESLGCGYVNNWSTQDFQKYVGKTLILRDHAGPAQGKIGDDGVESLLADIKAGVKFIHIDPWKIASKIEDAAAMTVALVERCLLTDNECHFEVGTEEAIFQYTASDLHRFLGILSRDLSPADFKKIVYCVIQSGTRVRADGNDGEFDAVRSKEMATICHSFGLKTKEHNSDYLGVEEFVQRRNSGVDSFNIAPELGLTETKRVLELLSVKPDLHEEFVDLCIKSGSWKKWIEPEANRERIASVCGHYVFSTIEFRDIVERLDNDRFDAEIRLAILSKLNYIYAALT